MKKICYVILFLLLIFSACGKRIKLPTNLPPANAGTTDTTYVPISPAWTEAGGIPFNHPQDVHVGFDGYIYIADTGNDRIVKFDQAGNFVAQYEGVKNPRSVSEDPLLRLLVTGRNTIYIKLKDNVTFDSLYAGSDLYDSIPIPQLDTIFVDTVIVFPDTVIEIHDTLIGMFDTTYIVDTIPTNFEAIAPDPRPISGYATYFVCDYTPRMHKNALRRSLEIQMSIWAASPV